MAKQKPRTKPSKAGSKSAGPARRGKTGESQTAVAATVLWTVAVATVLICDLAAAGAYAFTAWRPPAHRIFLLAEMLVFAGAVIGAIVLAMTPGVYRVRRTPPPQGLTVFAACVAVAPILAIAARMLR